jgi:hypothetical protein
VIACVLLGCSVGAYFLFFNKHSAATTNQAELPSYYVPGEQKCTVLVDFLGNRAELERLPESARASQIVRSLVAEYRRHGEQKGKDRDGNSAASVELIAVYINGKDNYGRPDFGNITRLMKLAAPATQLHDLTEADLANPDALRGKVTLDLFDAKKHS